MDIWGLTVAAMRRWYVLVPLLLISVAGALAVGSRSQADYEVSGAVMLSVPPQDPNTPNPYSQIYAVEILGIKATSSSTRSEFADDGLSEDYTITYDRRSPVLSLDVVADSAAQALDTADRIVEYVETTLNDEQGRLGVRKQHRVSLVVIDAPDVVEPVVSGRVRVTAVILAMGVLLSFLCAILLDAILTRRSRAREQRMHLDPAEGSDAAEGSASQAQSR